MEARVVRAADPQRVLWMNGQGWTREIARSPGAGPWSWRISIARSDSSATFSSFAGVERELVLIRGNGLTLRFDDGEEVTLRSGFDRMRFAGERAVVGEPLDGPTEQLNVMWRADIVDAEVVILREGEMALDVGAGQWLAIHARNGTVSLDGDHELAPGDSIVVAPGIYDESIHFTATGPALAVRIDPL